MTKKIPKNSKNKAPSFSFYPADWRGDLKLQLCSLETKGLWIELMCIMHDSDKYGYLLIDGKKPTEEELAFLLRIDIEKFKKCFLELKDREVIKVNDEGFYYSKRMVNDFKLKQLSKEYGKLGGNPKLKGVKGTVNPPLKKKKKYEVEIETVKEIVDDFNKIFNTKYKYNTKDTRELINARFEGGFTIEDFKTVHRNMAKKWGVDNKMREYLRPITLYTGKFESYLNMQPDLPFSAREIKNRIPGQEWLRKKEIEENG